MYMETKDITTSHYTLCEQFYLEMFLFYGDLFPLENVKLLQSFSIVEYILYVIIEARISYNYLSNNLFPKLSSPKHIIILSSS